MTSLSIDADISASVDLLGKSVSNLQSNIAIANRAITGTLLYVDDYTDFSEDQEKQVGNYIALHVNAPEDATVAVTVNGGEVVTVDDEMIAVCRITSTSQTIKVTGTLDGRQREQIYSLTGLTLNES